MTDWYIFREPERKSGELFDMIFVGLINNTWIKLEREQRLDKYQKIYPYDTIWAMKVVKGRNPLKSEGDKK